MLFPILDNTYANTDKHVLPIVVIDKHTSVRKVLFPIFDDTCYNIDKLVWTISAMINTQHIQEKGIVSNSWRYMN